MQTVYVGNTIINDFYLGNQKIDDVFTFDSASITTTNLLAWFRPESYTSGSSTWLSYTGSVAATASLNGATSLPKWNNTTASFRFTDTQTLNVEPRASFDLNNVDYTIIVAGRFQGTASDKHGRLLVSMTHGVTSTNLTRNWFLGTYDDGTEKTNAFYTYGTTGGAGWVYGPTGSYDTTWRIYGGSADITGGSTLLQYYVDGQFVSSSEYSVTGNIGPRSVGINTGSFCGGTAGGAENNNCEVGDILIYNRQLTEGEIKSIYRSLSSKYGL